MGGKAQPQMPPPVDTRVEDAAAKAEAKVAEEKKKTNNTIMTEKRGDWEENTKRSILGTKT